MKNIETFLWIIWLLSIVLLIVMLFVPKIPMIILFTLILVLIGFNIYLYQSEKKSFQKIREGLERLNLEPIEKEIRKIREEQTDYLTRSFKLEMELDEQKKELKNLQEKLEKLPRDQEMKYREIARKVLDLDNKMNEKFKLLGEAILKISKEREGRR